MLGKKNHVDRSLLCLDIGTSAIRAAVFEEEENRLKLRGGSLVVQQRGNLQGGSIVHLKETINNVQEAVKRAENQAKMIPKDLVIGLSAEMVKGSTVKLQFIRPKADKVIDDQELKTMIYELQWQAFDLIRKLVADEMCIPEMEVKLLNASIVRIAVDSEIVSDPRGLTGKIVTMEIFNCFSPVQHFGQIQNMAVELAYHELKGVFIQSFAISHCLSLKTPGISAVVVDIGAGNTDLSVISEGVIIGNRSFAMGGSTLTKRISHELSTSFEEAENIKLGYADESLDKKSYHIIQEAIQPDIDIWLSSFLFSLKELPIKVLPNVFLLCGNGSHLKEYSTALKSYPWKQHFPISDDIDVRHLNYTDILSADSLEEDLEFDFLPLIAASTASYDLLYHNSTVEGILNTVIADKAI